MNHHHRSTVEVESLEGRRLLAAQTPFHGTAFPVGSNPATIQAEDYDAGGEAVAYHDTTAANSGGAYRTGPDEGFDVKLINDTTNQYRLGDAVAGEWVEYTLDVLEAGDYRLELRLSQKDRDARMHVEVDGIDVTGAISVPDTNDFSVFTTVARTIPLAAGRRVLRLSFDAVATNTTVAGVDWLRLTRDSDEPPTAPEIEPDSSLGAGDAAYVRNGSYANQNFGAAPEILVKRSNTSGNTRESYLKFDVSTFAPGSINGAKLRLFGRLSASGTGVNVTAYSGSTAAWLDGTLTWNTRPAAGAALASKTISSTTAGWHEWDVTALVQQARANAQQFVTVALKATNTTDPWAIFNSNEAGSNQPELAVETSEPVPPQQNLVVSTGSLTVHEASQGSFTVKLATAPTSDVTVTISKNGGGDADLGTGSTSLTFTPDNWDVAQTVTVAARDDADSTDGQATFTIASDGLTSKTVTATEDDNDAPLPDEQDTLATSTTAYVRNGSYGDQNFGAATDLLVKRSANSGNTRESYVKFDVSSLAAGSIASAKLRLYGKLSAGGTGVSVGAFSVSNTGWTENGITWNTRPGSTGGALANKTISSTTAAWHEWDITAAVQQARAAGQQFVTIALKPNNTTDPWAIFNSDDAASNRPEVSVTISPPPPPPQSIVISTGSITVAEAGQASFTVKLSAAPASDVAVTISRNGEGDADLNADRATLVFTAANWDVAQTVHIAASDDADFEDGQAVFTLASTDVASKSVTATEDDNDIPQNLVVSTNSLTVNEASQGSFTVKLATAPTSDAMVTISKNTGGDDDLLADPTTLTFTADNWNVAQTVTLSAANDVDFTDGQATFVVSSAGLSSKNVIATENDDDAPPPPLTLTTSTAAYVRDGSYANQNFGSTPEIRVKRSRNLGNTRESYVQFDVSGLAAGSVTGAKLRLWGGLSDRENVNVAAFAGSNSSWTENGITWNNRPATTGGALASKSITSTTASWHEWDVTALVQEARANGQPFVTIALKPTSTTDSWAFFNSDEAPSNRPELSVTTAAPEPPPQSIVVSTGILTVNEAGQAAFTVKLGSAPTADVTVAVTKDAGGDEDLAADLTTLVFTAANWDVPQTVNVAALEDADFADGQATFTIGSTGVTAKTVIVTEDDNDLPPPPQNLVVSHANLTVNEAGQSAFTVKLAAAPTSDVVVTIAKDAGGDIDLSAGVTSLTFTAANWDVSQNVTLSALADPDTADGSATFTVSSAGLSSKTVVATEEDDDATRQPGTYYVNLNGNNANAGTSPAAPWQNIAKVNAMTFIPGDTILFQGLQSFSGSIYLSPSDSGTDANGNLIAPITLGSYGSGNATINAGNSFGFFAYNNGGITLQNLKFQGTGLSTNNADGIAFLNDASGNVKQSNVKVHNVAVHGFGMLGLGLGGDNGSAGYRNVEITDSMFYENRDGVTLYGPDFNASSPVYVNQDVRVANVLAYNNHGRTGISDPTGNGIVLGSVRDGVVERSVAHHNGANNSSITGPVGIWAYDSDRITIQYNESYANRRGTGSDGDGFDFDQNTSNSFMQYNYAHDNDGAGFLVYTGQNNGFHDNNVVRYNVSERDGRTHGYGGIVIGGKVTDLDVYNNTIYFPSGTFGTNGAAVFVTSIGNRVRVRNNILMTTGGARLISTPAVVNELLFQRNVYWAANGGATAVRWGDGVYSSIDGWLSAMPDQERVDLDNDGTLDLAALNVDPRLTAPGTGGTIGDADDLDQLTAYQLLGDSPVRDLGLDLQAGFGIDPGDLDFYGTTIKQGSGFDLGADEF